MAQLEHQAVRIENLELMAEYGTNAWKVSNEYVLNPGWAFYYYFIYYFWSVVLVLIITE